VRAGARGTRDKVEHPGPFRGAVAHPQLPAGPGLKVREEDTPVRERSDALSFRACIEDPPGPRPRPVGPPQIDVLEPADREEELGTRRRQEAVPETEDRRAGARADVAHQAGPLAGPVRGPELQAPDAVIGEEIEPPLMGSQVPQIGARAAGMDVADEPGPLGRAVAAPQLLPVHRIGGGKVENSSQLRPRWFVETVRERQGAALDRLRIEVRHHAGWLGGESRPERNQEYRQEQAGPKTVSTSQRLGAHARTPLWLRSPGLCCNSVGEGKGRQTNPE
jgi:hypothetical protein